MFVSVKDAFINIVRSIDGKEKIKRESIAWMIGLIYLIIFPFYVYYLATK